MLYAADVNPLLAVASARDMSFVPRIVQWFREHLLEPKPETLDLARCRAERLLSGAHASEPETDEDAYIVQAMAAILGISSLENMIADGGWKHPAWVEYAEGVGPLLAPLAQELLAALTAPKRPLFGSAISSTWPYYSYLRREEVPTLREALEKAAIDHPEITLVEFVDGFHNDLLVWLTEAEKRGTDIWLYAY
jgi:hypothetical protein